MKIEEIILQTQDIKKQFIFYADVLELPVVGNYENSCSFHVGASIITFVQAERSSPYHFAFNIPSNKEIEALIWLKQRVAILSFNNREMVNFESWNAKAIYFYDADNNIVEFIARKNLKQNDIAPFSSNAILNISEIGLPSTDMKSTFETLNSLKSISLYSGNFDRFGAVGDEEGMFILVNPLKKKWFPNDDEIHISDFEIKGDFNFKFSNGEILTQ